LILPKELAPALPLILCGFHIRHMRINPTVHALEEVLHRTVLSVSHHRLDCHRGVGLMLLNQTEKLSVFLDRTTRRHVCGDDSLRVIDDTVMFVAGPTGRVAASR